MPPRPRPRPANRQASDQVPKTASSMTQAVPLVKTDRELELDKGDELFLRNRNRTAKDWKRLDLLEKHQADQSSDRNSDVEDVSDASSGTPRKRRKTRQVDDGDLPRWTRQADISLLASDDESDAEIVDVTSREVVDPSSSAFNGDKRPRSRSRSLTPPPELSMHQIQNVRNVVRMALGNVPRPVSPSNEYIDESMESIVLDEDLASIAREVQAQVKDGGDLEFRGGPEDVTIKAHWMPHPQNPGGRADVWTFVMKRHDTFHALFEEIAATAGIPTRSLVVTHNGSRVFASATPHSLKIWAEAQMVASDFATSEYLREHRHERAPPTGALAQWSPPPGSADGDESESDTQSNAGGDGGDAFKLVVRSGVTEDVALKVRPTTSCGAIVKAFLKRAGIADKYLEGKNFRGKRGPRLMVDGEQMDPDTPISEADLEDGDQVEIGGL